METGRNIAGVTEMLRQKSLLARGGYAIRIVALLVAFIVSAAVPHLAAAIEFDTLQHHANTPSIAVAEHDSCAGYSCDGLHSQVTCCVTGLCAGAVLSSPADATEKLAPSRYAPRQMKVSPLPMNRGLERPPKLTRQAHLSGAGSTGPYPDLQGILQ